MSSSTASSPLPAHSKLGASSSHRWQHCPGSVALSASAGGDDEGSEHAKRGTYAHDVASKALLDGSEAWEHPQSEIYDVEDASAVQVYLDAVRAEIAELNAKQNQPIDVLIEQRHHLVEVHPDFYGTTDCTLIAAGQIQVWDYKHGVGIVVEAERNPQLMQYAVGALYHTDAWTNDAFVVELNICQPRAFHRDGAIRSWFTTVGELKDWLNDTWLPAAKATAAPGAPLIPGPWCNTSFCPNRMGCSAISDMMARIRGVTKDDIMKMEDWELGQFGQDLNVLLGTRKEWQLSLIHI